MRALIAITSYEGARTNGMNQAVRDTWLPALADIPNVDCRFFSGRGTTAPLQNDEVCVNAGDDYENITNKVIESTRWALNRRYDLIFRTYPDVYIRPERLMAAIMPDKAYVGYPVCVPNSIPYASGGASYWLRAQEAAYLLDTKVPYDWAEDRWVGHVMHEHGVTLWADQRYSPWAKPILKRNDKITAHLSRSMQDGQAGVYKPQWMHNVHKFWQLSQSI
jgi:hypothetical protein